MQFADGHHDEIADQPERACLAAGCKVRGGRRHDQIGECHAQQRRAHSLAMVDISVPRRACQAHSLIRIGVKTKIISGLSARNQVVGISPLPEAEVDASARCNLRPTTAACCPAGRRSPRRTSPARTRTSSPTIARRSPRVERRARLRPALAAGASSSGGRWRMPDEIDREADQHADAGGREAVVPADLAAERAGDQRRQERPDIDADIVDRVGAHAARVVRARRASRLASRRSA